MSDANKILIEKSMVEKNRKYKCCVFIDFEYMFLLQCYVGADIIIIVFFFLFPQKRLYIDNYDLYFKKVESTGFRYNQW